MWSPDQEVTPTVDIPLFFERYGWKFETVGPLTYRTGFRGNHDAFPVLVRVTQHWVVFTINPLLRGDNGMGATTLLTLAQSNHVSNFVKFGLDPEGDVFLTVELPVDGFTYVQFSDALRAISHTADQFSVSLLQAQAIDRAQSN